MRQLNPREKVMAAAVGGIAFLLINAAFLNYVLRQQARIRAEIATQTAELSSIQKVAGERDLWQQREDWITQTQPKLTNEGGAGVQLLDSIKEIARNHQVTIENPIIGVMERDGFHRAVPVSLETKSSWPALVAFLAQVQRPDQFIVFDNVNIQIEATDATQIRGRFRMSRWYAP